MTQAITQLVEALEWYGENARLFRLIHSEGDPGRNALSADGGKKAAEAIAAAKAAQASREGMADAVNNADVGWTAVDRSPEEIAEYGLGAGVPDDQIIAPRAKPLADWSNLPRDLYVIEAQSIDGIGFDVKTCSVPMALAPEVRYVRADAQAPREPSEKATQKALQVFIKPAYLSGDPRNIRDALRAAYAVDAITGQPARDGWALVPIEPSDEMMEAARFTIDSAQVDEQIARILAEMIASAPKGGKTL